MKKSKEKKGEKGNKSLGTKGVFGF